MSRNTALITDAAQVQAQSDLDNYAAGVAAHLGGDWGGHTQVKQHPITYSCGAGVVAINVFRFLLSTAIGTDVAIICPAYPVGPLPVGGVPLIALQPLSQTVALGTPYQVRVYAASDISINYQWQANDGTGWADISTALAATYLVPAAAYPPAPAAHWLYRCFVSNARGGVYSDAASITVTAS